MKAIGIPKHGDTSLIQEYTLPQPVPRPDELLVKVSYVGVNFIDLIIRRGIYPRNVFPHVMGQESVGTIVKLPESKDVLENEDFKKLGFKVGDRVVSVSPSSARWK